MDEREAGQQDQADETEADALRRYLAREIARARLALDGVRAELDMADAVLQRGAARVGVGLTETEPGRQQRDVIDVRSGTLPSPQYAAEFAQRHDGLCVYCADYHGNHRADCRRGEAGAENLETRSGGE